MFYCPLGNFLIESFVRFVYLNIISMDETKAAKEFAKRFNLALDMRSYPALGRGRITYIQEVFSISRAGANKWLHGQCIPHKKSRRLIAEKLGISLSWLETGDGSATETGESQYQSKTLIKEIPLLNLAQAARDITPDELTQTPNIPISNESPIEVIAIQQAGNSMSPRFVEGSILITKKTEEIKDGDFVIAKIENMPEAIFRQFIIGAEGNYLIAINPSFMPQLIDKSTKIIGKVIEIRSSL